MAASRAAWRAARTRTRRRPESWRSRRRVRPRSGRGVGRCPRVLADLDAPGRITEDHAGLPGEGDRPRSATRVLWRREPWRPSRTARTSSRVTSRRWHQSADTGNGRRPTGAPTPEGPAAFDQLDVPAQHRPRRGQQPAQLGCHRLVLRGHQPGRLGAAKSQGVLEHGGVQAPQDPAGGPPTGRRQARIRPLRRLRRLGDLMDENMAPYAVRRRAGVPSRQRVRATGLVIIGAADRGAGRSFPATISTPRPENDLLW
jgi:hypothetical protein